MPRGKYERTPEHRRILSEIQKNRMRSPEERSRISKGLMGHIVTEETRDKIRKNHARQWLGKRNEDTAHWVGDSVGYSGLHDWVRKEKGSPLECENCDKRGGTTKNYHWANISGKYIRDINDFIRLCASCHKLFDLGKIEIRGIKKI